MASDDFHVLEPPIPAESSEYKSVTVETESGTVITFSDRLKSEEGPMAPLVFSKAEVQSGE